MAGESWILVVQRSSTWLCEYILISLDFLFSSRFIIVNESYLFGSSVRRRFSKISNFFISSFLIQLIFLHGYKSSPKQYLLFLSPKRNTIATLSFFISVSLFSVKFLVRNVSNFLISSFVNTIDISLGS